MAKRGKTSSATWKSFERRVAKFFGVERYSKTRQGEVDAPDVYARQKLRPSVQFAIECKIRGASGFPKTIYEMMKQSQKNILTKKDVPFVVVKEKHKRDDEAVVLMRWGDFKKMCQRR